MSDAVFASMKKSFAANPAPAKKLKCSFKFVIKTAGGQKVWLLDAKSDTPKIEETAESTAADCTIIIAEADFLDLVSGKSDGMKLMMAKKMQLKGNMMLAQKLGSVFQESAKM